MNENPKNEKVIQLKPHVKAADQRPRHIVLFIAELAKSPKAYTVALQAYVELLAKGFTDTDSIPDPESPAIIVQSVAGEIVGILCMSATESGRAVFVDVSWVSPNHRRQGIWSMMWKALTDGVVHFHFDEAQVIYGSCHAKNEEMKKAMESAGRELTYLTYATKVQR